MHAAAVYVLGLGIFWKLGKNLTQVKGKDLLKITSKSEI
jgi:hypothetical protein